MFLQQFLSLVDCAAHSFCVGSKNQVSPVRRQQTTSFFAHGVRHGQNKPVTLYRRDQCQTYAGIAAGWFNDGVPRLDFPLAFSGCEHIETDTVVSSTESVDRLDLCPYCRVVFSRNSSQAHDGYGADKNQSRSGTIHSCYKYSLVSDFRSNSIWHEKNSIFLSL